MNKINGITFHNKIREIIPNFPISITPEFLNDLCEDDIVQPFLEWFISSISLDNLVTEEDNRMIQHIKSHNEWHEGIDLENNLLTGSENNADLTKLIKSDYHLNNQAVVDYNIENDTYNWDLEYSNELEQNLIELKEYQYQLDEAVNNEIEALKREEIKVNIIYDNCINYLDEFDLQHRQLYTDIELLCCTYKDALQKRGETFIWTQLPIEVFNKKMNVYTNYLHVYAKRQFFKLSSDNSLNNTNYLPDSSFQTDCQEEKVQLLLSTEKKLLSTKMENVLSKIEESSSRNLLTFAMDIYNNGNLKVPKTVALVRAEIADLTKNRDFLEEKVKLLQEQNIIDVIQQYTKLRINKIMEEEAEVKLLRRNKTVEKLEKLFSLVKEQGHSFTYLLVMLMELQSNKIDEMIQFVLDSKKYLSQHYKLSSVRCESMQALQNEYLANCALDSNKNSFYRALIDLVTLEEERENVEAVKQYYDELVISNRLKLKELLEDNLHRQINKANELGSIMENVHNRLVKDNPTSNYEIVPYSLTNAMADAEREIMELESQVEVVQKKLRQMIKEISAPSLQREKLLLWQKFLVEPEILTERYKELKEIIERQRDF